MPPRMCQAAGADDRTPFARFRSSPEVDDCIVPPDTPATATREHGSLSASSLIESAASRGPGARGLWSFAVSRHVARRAMGRRYFSWGEPVPPVVRLAASRSSPRRALRGAGGAIRCDGSCGYNAGGSDPAYPLLWQQLG